MFSPFYRNKLIFIMEKSTITGEKDYNISFFRPTTKLAKFNRNLILILFSIWAVSIFGFQIFLRVVEEPVPEKAYVEYEGVWSKITSETASIQDKQTYIKSALSILGKVTIAVEDRSVLNASVKKLTLELIPIEEQAQFQSKIEAFKKLDFNDANYQASKKDLSIHSAIYIGTEPYSLEAKLIPLELAAAENTNFDFKSIEIIMSKYLIHNQSFLTDTQFLGFPFHYFYTAVWLLILFVLLCLYYCIATDRAMKRLEIIED